MWSYNGIVSFLITGVVASLLTPVFGKPVVVGSRLGSRGYQSVIKPKVFIINMFEPEAKAWYDIPEFNVLDHNVTIPGFSPLFPDAHCTSDGSVCQLITGEGEINAASTITALVYSGLFDLTTTYFLIAGIAGVNPKMATIGSVTFARYAVQVALQQEFDAREKPSDFPTGYVPQGSYAPNQYPQLIYGTEVFELNTALRALAVNFARTASLNDTLASQEQRELYANVSAYAAGAAPPNVTECDTATADVFFSGLLLAEAFENTTTLFTNGTGVYCTAQQEDNATLESLLRATLAGLVDFSRIILMRTASDFDRQYDGETAAANLFGDAPGYAPAVLNVYLAGVKVVEGIVQNWEIFENGIKPTNYVGDILGSLGGEPDFGPGSVFGGPPATASATSMYAVGVEDDEMSSMTVMEQT